ncbi:hypothetical protein PGTUg99_028011 [Puccinia graminis f. sp. tritici]|uniref:Rho-GAP domain-containing protein n=1 Tax=Puccinia graminis f. sp. tritici TaxID=56615 RepID=A0A5B0RR60_PUCGR|nr:hypothetical protein PGTUg99_028011 [Puccinia graminis f. sp. tritici]
MRMTINHPLHDQTTNNNQDNQQEQEQEQQEQQEQPTTNSRLKKLIKRSISRLIINHKPKKHQHQQQQPQPLLLNPTEPLIQPTNSFNPSLSQHTSPNSSSSTEFSWRPSPSWFKRSTTILIPGLNTQQNQTQATGWTGRKLGPSAALDRLSTFSGLSSTNTRPSSSTNLHSIFGISIKEAIAISSQSYHAIRGNTLVLPTIIFSCAERLKANDHLAMATPGIFRINGNVKRMRELEDIFIDPTLNYGKSFDLATPKHKLFPLLNNNNNQNNNQNNHNNPYFSLHDVAGVLRRYLWALPEPLVPNEATIEMLKVYRRYREEQGGGGVGDGRSRTISIVRTMVVEELEAVLRRQMAKESLDLLFYLLELLGLFSARSSDNLMTAKNLAIVFQPGIIHLPNHSIPDTPQHYQARKPQSICPTLHSSLAHSPDLAHHPSSATLVHPNLGLQEYLGLIDEVQEVLRLLIEHFASLLSASRSLLLPSSPSPSSSSSSNPTPNSHHLPTLSFLDDDYRLLLLDSDHSLLSPPPSFHPLLLPNSPSPPLPPHSPHPLSYSQSLPHSQSLPRLNHRQSNLVSSSPSPNPPHHHHHTNLIHSFSFIHSADDGG